MRKAAMKPRAVTRTARHRTIWNATLHCWEKSLPVRVRNISEDGALVACEVALEIGTQVVLDLTEAGAAPAEVRWLHDGYTGLQFNSRFDLSELARLKPSYANNLVWAKPDYLEDISATSPWAARPRLSIEELAKSLDQDWPEE